MHGPIHIKYFNLALGIFFVRFLSYRVIKHCLFFIRAQCFGWPMNERIFILLRANVDSIRLLYTVNSFYVVQYSVFGTEHCGRVVRGSNHVL